jgi:hypothetical protein
VTGPLTRRHCADHPVAAANDLVLCHQDIVKAVAAKLSCRTGRSREDLEQIEMVGNVLSACSAQMVKCSTSCGIGAYW